MKYVRFQAGSTVAYGMIEGIGSASSRAIRSASRSRPRQPSSQRREAARADRQPSKVLAVGLNYRSHLGDRPVPKVPEIFFKVVLPGPRRRPIVIPKGSDDVHYEGEMVISSASAARTWRRQGIGLCPGRHLRERRQRPRLAEGGRAVVAGQGHRHLRPLRAVYRLGLDYDDLRLARASTAGSCRRRAPGT